LEGKRRLLYSWRVLERKLAELWLRGRPAVMGVVNVTPDSFSDGGRWAAPEAAVAHALGLVDAGADMLDVGGESTRPGAAAVSVSAEIERVVPVVAALARRRPAAIVSVDTSKPEVAAAALAAGASLVNDVTAGRDGRMFGVVAGHGAGIVLMHMRGEPATMQLDTAYDDVVAEVCEFLVGRAAAAAAAGIPAGRTLLDPGIGFGKDAAGNLQLLAALPDLAALGYPVVVGASRKSFIAAVAGEAGPSGRLGGSLAAVTGTARLPRAVVRVHDVRETVQFLALLAALEGAA
jgi:dihydropteroate synthase